jgi:hypothetical protein
MLYNPRWNPLESSLQDLVSWLETKNPEETYVYYDSENCCLCNFLKSKGVAHPIINRDHWYSHTGTQPVNLPPHFNFIAEGSVFTSLDKRWTYGQALARAKKCL